MISSENHKAVQKGKDIFILPVREEFLLYVPRQGILALLNPAAAAYMIDWARGGGMIFNHASLRELVTRIETEPMLQVDGIDGVFDPDFLGIVGSRNCNMDCSYCGFREGLQAGQRLDPSIMTAAIRFFAELKKRLGYSMFKIEFFGGEPFVEMELLDIAIHHSRLIGAKQGIYPSFRALTNGLLDQRQREMAFNYFDHLTVSCDGQGEFHDFSRRGSHGEGTFNRVRDTMRYLSDRGANFSIRCCVTSRSVGSMPEIAAWFCREFSPASVNFETLSENPFSHNAGLYPPDPYEFARKCYESWIVLEQHRVEAVYAPVSLDCLHRTTCPVGRDTIIVHPDGSLASCYLVPEEWSGRGLDLFMGWVAANGQTHIDMDRVLAMRQLTVGKPRCESCFCKFSCAGNCHVSLSYPDAPQVYAGACLQVRILTMCRLLQAAGYECLADQFVSDTRAARWLNDQKSDLITSKKNL